MAALGYLAVDVGCSLAGVGLAGAFCGLAYAFAFFGLSAWRTFCTRAQHGIEPPRLDGDITPGGDRYGVGGELLVLSR